MVMATNFKQKMNSNQKTILIMVLTETVKEINSKKIISKDLPIILVICKIIYKENKIKKTKKNLQTKTIKMKNRKRRVFLRLLLKKIQIIQSRVKQHLLLKNKDRNISPCIIKTSFKSIMNLKKIYLYKTSLIFQSSLSIYLFCHTQYFIVQLCPKSRFFWFFKDKNDNFVYKNLIIEFSL